MAQKRLEIAALQETIKHLMSRRGLKLNDMVAHFGISIATAKRLLNGDDLSLDRVLELCEWMDIEWTDVVQLANRRRVEYHFCSEEQEDYLARRSSHFAFLKALQRGDDPEMIRERYSLDKSDIDAYLIDLETNGFLRMNATGKIELIIGDGMDWRPNGSLWNAYYHRWIQEVTSYMALKDTPDKYTSVEISQRKFTKETIAALRKEVDELSRKYAAISRLERRVHSSDALEYYTLSILGDRWTAPLYNVEKYGHLPSCGFNFLHKK